jgi:hypothetical protein
VVIQEKKENSFGFRFNEFNQLKPFKIFLFDFNALLIYKYNFFNGCKMRQKSSAGYLRLSRFNIWFGTDLLFLEDLNDESTS